MQTRRRLTLSWAVCEEKGGKVKLNISNWRYRKFLSTHLVLFFFVLVRVFLRLCWLVPRTWPTVWSWFDRVVSSPARFTWWKIQILLNLFKPEFSPDVGIRCRPHCRVHLCLKCGHDVVHSPESGPPGDVSRIILCWRFKTPPSLRWGGGSYLE